MFTKFKTETQKIFLDPDVDVELQSQKLEVILSPSLYWVRRFELPVRNQKEARKLLPSLFEDFLPEGDFRFYGYFEGEEYVAFAYEEEKIRSLLVQKGVELANVEALYFAQSEFSKEALPIQLPKGWVLECVDGVVLKLPFSQAQERNPLDVQNIQLSQHAIKIERYDSPIEKKTLLLLCGFFLLFGLLYGAQWYRFVNASASLEKRSTELFEKYSLLPTMMQNRVVLKKYEKIDKKQKKLRRVFDALLKVPARTGCVLEKVSVEKNTLKAVFGNLKNPQSLQNRLEELKPTIKPLQNNKALMEVAL